MRPARNPAENRSMHSIRLERWDPADGRLSERRLQRALEHEGYEVVGERTVIALDGVRWSREGGRAG